jgi:7,8-dihydropterin-6-yl-methyl-4-(beta-D-ribofuranosyl)aminobenzene 5'-phosphate synthase
MIKNEFSTTQDVQITVLVDNRADLLTHSTDEVYRFTNYPLLAEHGFSVLIDLLKENKRILWDAGMTRVAFLENTKHMAIDLSTVDMIALSHGHSDHTAAINDVLKAAVKLPAPKRWKSNSAISEIDTYSQPQLVPLVAHPGIFRERWKISKDGIRNGPTLPPSRKEWEASGADIILSEAPYQLAPGCWTTGEVPRNSFENAGVGPERFYREGNQFHQDLLEDDQAIVFNVRDKGLVVLSGCAHSGIVNTVQYAQEISGIERVYAVLGGFHLAPADQEDIERTIQFFEKLSPHLISPSHCTGFNAIRQFANRMPDAFVLGLVGSMFKF